MVIQAHVTSYDEIDGKERQETCILCIERDKNCFTAAMAQLEDYYGETLSSVTNIKILSETNFLVLQGKQEPIDEELIIG